MKANILTASLVEIRRNVEKIASAFDAVSPEGLSGTGTRMEKINKGVATARWSMTPVGGGQREKTPSWRRTKDLHAIMREVALLTQRCLMST